MTTWVLVANRVGARLFEQDRGKHLSLLSTVDHDSGRTTDNALETGPQRTFDAHAKGRSAEDRGTSPQDQDAHRFAHRLAKLLEEGRTSRAVARMVLVAEPSFLGVLRAEVERLNPGILLSTVPKDLQAVGDGDVSSHLDPVLLPS